MQGDFRMTFGEHKGQPVSAIPTHRLLWHCTQEAARKTRPNDIRALIAELRQRLSEPGRVETELLGDVPIVARDLI
jgi:hypothetical protein